MLVSVSMKHMNRLALLAILLTAGVCGAVAQNVSKFDVASVKPSQPGNKSDCNSLPGGRFACHNIPAINLLVMAFADQPLTPKGRFPKIKGAPSWMNDQQYDIDAIAEGAGEMSAVQVARHLLVLFQERFGLVAHLETVQEGGFSLEQEGSGAKFKPSAPDAVYAARRLPDGVIFTAATMQILAATAGNRSDVRAAVIDNTGLDGKYDFKYRYNYAAAEAPEDVTKKPDGGTSTFDALEELGLRLVPTKVTVSVIVIDQIHKPTEN